MALPPTLPRPASRLGAERRCWRGTRTGTAHGGDISCQPRAMPNRGDRLRPQGTKASDRLRKRTQPPRFPGTGARTGKARRITKREHEAGMRQSNRRAANPWLGIRYPAMSAGRVSTTKRRPAGGALPGRWLQRAPPPVRRVRPSGRRHPYSGVQDETARFRRPVPPASSAGWVARSRSVSSSMRGASQQDLTVQRPVPGAAAFWAAA